MSLMTNRMGRIATVLVIFGLMGLALSACETHQELKSSCHVAATGPDPDCTFTPIRPGAV